MDEAWRTLGLEPTHDRKVVRAAFVSAIRRTHPDRNPAPDAHERTAALIAAYHAADLALRRDEATAQRLARQASRRATSSRGAPTATRTRSAATATSRNRPATGAAPRNGATVRADRAEATAPPPRPERSMGRPLQFARIDDADLLADGPVPDVVRYLTRTLDGFAEVLLSDPDAGLVQVAVRFGDGPMCHLMFELAELEDDRSHVAAAIESLEARPAPPVGAAIDVLLPHLGA